MGGRALSCAALKRTIRMTPAPKPTLTDRFMTFLFGKRFEGEALERLGINAV